MHEETFSQTQMQATFRPKPDGAVDPIGEAGWYLERERVKRGLSLQAAGRATDIHPHHLQAIEMGDLGGLPEREEALRMVGAYAAFLGFDPKPLVAHFDDCLPRDEAGRGKTSARIVAFPLIERLRSSVGTTGGMVASALAGVMLFGGLAWSVWPGAQHQAGAGKALPVIAAEQEPGEAGQAKSKPRKVAAHVRENEQALEDTGETRTAQAPADPIAALIEQTMPDVVGKQPAAEKTLAAAKPAEKAAEKAADKAADKANEKSSKRLAKETSPARPEKLASLKAPTPPPAPTAQAGAEAKEAAGKQDFKSAPPKTARDTAHQADHDNGNGPLAYDPLRPRTEVPGKGLAIRASERIWVRVEDNTGKAHFSGFLNEGQVLALPKDRQLRITAGNVHRLELYRNGRSLGVLGKRGADLISVPVQKLSSLKLY